MERYIINSILIFYFKLILSSFTLILTGNEKPICVKKIHSEASIRTTIQDHAIKKKKKKIISTLTCESKNACMCLRIGCFWTWEKAIKEDESKIKQHLSVLSLREEKRE